MICEAYATIEFETPEVLAGPTCTYVFEIRAYLAWNRMEIELLERERISKLRGGDILSTAPRRMHTSHIAAGVPSRAIRASRNDVRYFKASNYPKLLRPADMLR